MKFKGVKKGDKVFLIEATSAGWGSEVFFIPKEVTHVTPKRFHVGPVTYKRDNGRQLGDYWNRALLEGEDYHGNVVRDQTKERDELKKKLEGARRAEGIFEEAARAVGHDTKNLDKVLELAIEIERLLEETV